VSIDVIGCHKSLVYIGQQTRQFILVNKPAGLYWSTNPPVYIGQQTRQFILVNKSAGLYWSTNPPVCIGQQTH
jgi:hypothetical protein